MAGHDDDARSDSSWLHASCDVRSESSWLLAGGAEVQGQPGHGEDDLQSNMSWEVVLERDHFDSLPMFLPPQDLRRKSNRPCFSDLDASLPLTELIRNGQAEAALHLLRKAPELAAQLNESGESALSWTVYKAKCNNIAWLELTCELLKLSPAHARKTNSMRFLPLHDAAWGNAPSAIAIALCAVFPFAAEVEVLVRAGGRTPHQVGDYHHTTRQARFAWPAPGEMLQAARALSHETGWLETVTSLRLSSLDEQQLRYMSVKDLQVSLDVGQCVAELIACFLRPAQRQAPAWAMQLPSIAEQGCNGRLVESTCEAITTRTRSLPELSWDEPHVMERCSKDSARNSSKVLQQKVKSPKWPSKAGLKRERQRNRAEKETLR